MSIKVSTKEEMRGELISTWALGSSPEGYGALTTDLKDRGKAAAILS